MAYTDGTSQYNRSGSVGSDLYGTSPAYSSAYLASRYGSTSGSDRSTTSAPRYASAYLNYGTLQPQHMMMVSTQHATQPSIASTQSTTMGDHSAYYAPSHSRYTEYLR